MPTDVATLNAQFALPDQLNFVQGLGNLVMAEIDNQYGQCTVALQGAQVIAWQPRDHEQVIFLSDHAIFAPGTSIRGGIPVCWPWFGPHPSDPGKPQHGFVRMMEWAVTGAAAIDGATRLLLALHDSEHTRSLWPHTFALELIVTAGATLEVELVARNTGAAAFSCSDALHSYFSVGDARRIEIGGLENTAYLDKVDNYARKTQDGAITISGEIDRVYLDTTATCVIDDPQMQRRIVIGKAGSRTTVVWNPWREKARTIKDFGDDEYLKMVCVETANAADDVITIAPGDEYRLRAMISVM